MQTLDANMETVLQLLAFKSCAPSPCRPDPVSVWLHTAQGFLLNRCLGKQVFQKRMVKKFFKNIQIQTSHRLETN